MREIYVTDGKYILSKMREEDFDVYIKLLRENEGDASLFLDPGSRDLVKETIFHDADEKYVQEMFQDGCSI